jgi:hypothetical protein
MRPAEMDVRAGNQRRKKAAAALLTQMQARAGNSSAGLGGIRQSGGLARAGAKAGIIRGQGRGIPAGLEGLYARAGDFARQNQLGDYSLNVEQQTGAQDPGIYAGQYAAANAPAAPVQDSGGLGGQTTYQAGETIAPAPVGSNPFVTGEPGGAGAGGTATGDPEANQFMAGTTDINPFGGFSSGGGSQGAPQDGQPMNGGVYYQGTIIPMGVWRAIQQDMV